jgi:hypothetical protein
MGAGILFGLVVFGLDVGRSRRERGLETGQVLWIAGGDCCQ